MPKFAIFQETSIYVCLKIVLFMNNYQKIKLFLFFLICFSSQNTQCEAYQGDTRVEFQVNPGASGKKTPSSQDLAALIVRAIRINDEKVGAAEMRIRSVIEDPTVTKAKKVTIVGSGQRSLSYEMNPRLEFISHVIYHNDKYRYDFLDTNKRIDHSFCFDGFRWTEIDLRKNIAILRRTDQMAKLQPFDPREIASTNIQISLEALLKRGTVKASETKYTLAVKDVNGLDVLIDFDPTLGMMPVLSQWKKTNGDLFQKNTIGYQQITPNGAYLLKKAEIEHYTHMGDFQNKNIQTSFHTVKNTIDVIDFKILEPIVAERELNFSVPKSIRLQDHTTLTKEPFEIHQSKSQKNWIIFAILNLLLIGGIACWKFRSKR